MTFSQHVPVDGVHRLGDRFPRPRHMIEHEVFAHQQGVLFDHHDGPGLGADLDACESGYCMT